MPSTHLARTEKIVASAAFLFARHGYRGTTTREIARMAEVSENTLFRHFDRKEAIFWSALRSHESALTLRNDLLERIRGGASLEVVLPKLLEVLTETVNCKPEVIRLIAIAGLELPGRGEALCRDLVSPLFSEVRRYMATCIDTGQVVKVDPSLLVVSLMAMVLMCPQISKLANGEAPYPINDREAVRAYSTFWLEMLSPRSTGASISGLNKEGQASIEHGPKISVAFGLQTES
jgi:AcrR family transcriptional regulator